MNTVKNKIKIILFVLLCNFCCMNSMYGQNLHSENLIVEKIEVVIASKADAKSSKLQLLTKTKLKTHEGNLFSQTAFDNDLKMLVQDFDRVEPLIESIDGKIFITLKVWEKPTIRNIIWEGRERINQSDLESELGIHKGAVFDRQNFNQAFHNVKTYYVKQGFFEAQLNYNVKYDEAKNEIDIVIEINEGRAGKIENIVFFGATKAQQNAISEMMVTKKYNFFLSWLNGGGTYNEDMIQHDKFQILNYFHNLGYADAKIDLNVREIKDSHRIIVEISIEKGTPYFFGAITVEGNHLFSREEILGCLTIDEGEPYSPEQIHNSLQAVTTLYGKKGYIEAFVNYEPQLCEHGNVFDINITVDEGEKYLVGMIKVMGNNITQTKVILHETLLIPGEVFNLQKLQITEARLTNIGYFKNVNVYAVKTDSCSILPGNYRDVHIEVEEGNTGHLGASFGFSSDESLFGEIKLTERNFNARGLKYLWSEGFRALRGGGEYFHINFTLGSKAQSYGIAWTKPYFMDTPWTVGFDLEKGYNQYITDKYEISTYGMTLHATYACNAFVRLGTHYRLKYSDIDIEEEGKCDECKALKRQARNDGLISALGLTWMYDSTDNPQKPSRGLKSRIEGEIAGLGGKRTFLSLDYLNSYYYDLWGKGTLKFRADLRFIQPLGNTGPNDIPLDERFFLGGDSDVRGYRPYRLGEKFCGDKDDPKGGISQQLFSIEYSKALFSRLEAFVFYDAGAVTMEKWDFGHIYQSRGFGARIKLFEGTPPLTLGMGFPINHPFTKDSKEPGKKKQDRSDIKKFFISVGGKF